MSSKKRVLMVEILEHELVPEHIILSKREARKLLANLNIKPEQLPWIKDSDPIVQIIGAKPGDIIKVIRKSPTAGTHVAYRYVIEKGREK
ncbi:MAG: DNA-directed RNA polymerase subunit H [Candidatus Baldrarchaeia archaeon]